MKRLYRVDVEFSYYVIATDEYDAVIYASDAADDIHPSEHARAREVRPGQPFANDWTRDSVVYGTREVVTLGEALDALAGQAKQETTE